MARYTPTFSSPVSSTSRDETPQTSPVNDTYAVQPVKPHRGTLHHVPCGFEPVGGARLSERFSSENGTTRYALVRLSEVWDRVGEQSLTPVVAQTPYKKAQLVKISSRMIAFKFDSLREAERAVRHPNPAIARETLDLLGPAEFLRISEWVNLAGGAEPRPAVHPFEGQVVLEITTTGKLAHNSVADSYYAALEFLDEHLGRNQVRAFMRLPDATGTVFTNEFGSGFRYRLEVDLLRVATDLKSEHQGTRIGKTKWSATVVDYSKPGVETLHNPAVTSLTVSRPRASNMTTTPRRGGRNAADNGANAINLQNIRDGIDVRTTVMVRNIPNKMNTHDLLDLLQKLGFGKFDFTYLRIDFRNGFNVGYAFVNFSTAIDIVHFYQRLMAHGWPSEFGSGKSPAVSYATVQGTEALVEKFRNSSVMLETLDYRPRLFHTREAASHLAEQTRHRFHPFVGAELAFPGPNNEAKLQRSRQNAETQGLWPAHTREDQRRARHTTYDRGNPNALAMLPPATPIRALTPYGYGPGTFSARFSSATSMPTTIMTPRTVDSRHAGGFHLTPLSSFASSTQLMRYGNHHTNDDPFVDTVNKYHGHGHGGPSNGHRFNRRRS